MPRGVKGSGKAKTRAAEPVAAPAKRGGARPRRPIDVRLGEAKAKLETATAAYEKTRQMLTTKIAQLEAQAATAVSDKEILKAVADKSDHEIEVAMLEAKKQFEILKRAQKIKAKGK